MTREQRVRIAQYASDVRWHRAGKHHWPDGSFRKIRLYLSLHGPGKRDKPVDLEIARQTLRKNGVYPAIPRPACIFCGHSVLRPRPPWPVCDNANDNWACSPRGMLRPRAPDPDYPDTTLLHIARRAVLRLRCERPDPRKEYPPMPPPDATFEPGPLADRFDLMQFTADLIQDLRDLRQGRITVPDARARAELARQVVRSVNLVITAQRYLEQRALPAPSEPAPDPAQPAEAEAPGNGEEVIPPARKPRAQPLALGKLRVGGRRRRAA